MSSQCSRTVLLSRGRKNTRGGSPEGRILSFRGRGVVERPWRKAVCPAVLAQGFFFRRRLVFNALKCMRPASVRIPISRKGARASPPVTGSNHGQDARAPVRCRPLESGLPSHFSMSINSSNCSWLVPQGTHFSSSGSVAFNFMAFAKARRTSASRPPAWFALSVEFQVRGGSSCSLPWYRVSGMGWPSMDGCVQSFVLRKSSEGPFRNSCRRLIRPS